MNLTPVMEQRPETPVPTAACPPAAASICIVSHNAYGAISGGLGGFVGGVERQTSLLAAWLAGQGYRVSLITWNEGGPSEEYIRGVRVIKICKKDAGVPGIRFFHPKWTGLVDALRRADADVYFHNCGECVTGQIAMWCRMRRKPFVFSLASDADCNPELPELSSWRERVLFRYGLKKAGRRIAQTEGQKARLRKHFDLDCDVIPMPAPGPPDVDYEPPARQVRRVLWVGRVCRVKRPEILMEIAMELPDVEFFIAGPIYDDAAGRAVTKKAGGIPNLKVLGAVARSEMPGLYRSASLLCCTSEYEGFPNTFVEAWSHGVPVVSTVDPDGVIERYGLGRVAACGDSLVRGIGDLLRDPGLYADSSRNARRRYREYHSMDVVMPKYGQLLLEATRSERR